MLRNGLTCTIGVVPVRSTVPDAARSKSTLSSTALVDA
jgi:hypothetical protein